METGDGTNSKRIKAEDVICKLKDDGDFDKLRLIIVRKMKENDAKTIYWQESIDMLNLARPFLESYSD